MSNTANSPVAPAWQATLVGLEAQSLEVWRLGREQVKQVQAKRQSARAAAAHLAEAERRLAACENRSKESEKLALQRNAVLTAKGEHEHALAEYEEALKLFHQQRAKLQKESEALSRRREAVSGALPTLARRAYVALLASDIPDRIAALHDGRCAACDHDLARETPAVVIVCPSCQRLIVQASS